MTTASGAPEALSLLLGVGQALGCGLLVGIERGWQARGGEPGTRVAGIRTFGLLGLLGGVAACLPIAAAALIAGAAAMVVVAGYLRQAGGSRSASVTGAIVALIVLALGWMAGAGRGVAALAVAAAVTLVLASRRALHTWLASMAEGEVKAIARFAVVALLVLPLLPDRSMGPYDAINPRDLWLVVVFVSGLSFAGYLLAKRLGPGRGLLVTAACGAIVSSTAVTVAFARRLGSDAPNRQLVGGVAIASAVMFARVLVLIAVLAPSALLPIAMAVTPALVVTAPFVVMALRPGDLGEDEPRPLDLGNPLDLRPALLLSLMLAALAVASRWALDRLGDAGVGALLALTGVADVDAAVITFSRLPPGSLAPRAAALALVAPVLLNTAFKAGLAIAFGARPFGLRAATPLILAVLAGGAAAFLLWLA